MHTITGNLEEITGHPAPAGSRLLVSAPQGRPSSTGSVIYPGETPVPVDAAGDFSFSAHPGPLRVRFDLPGVTWREGPVLHITVPEGQGPTPLTSLWAVQSDYDPPIIGIVETLMQQTVSAAVRAEQAAGDLEGAVEAAEQAVSGKSDVGHTHPVSEIQATGTPGEGTFLAGDGSWKSPDTVDYSTLTYAEAVDPESTTGRLVTGQRLHQAITEHASPTTYEPLTQEQAEDSASTGAGLITGQLLAWAVFAHTPMLRVSELPAEPDPGILYVVVP